MTQEKIGRILPEPEARDAIHIAVAAVIATEPLTAGQHIGLLGDDEHAGKCDTTIGIVDPFLRRPVEPGQRFWMFLYPNSIVSLRHQWLHPAFKSESPLDDLRVNAELVAKQCGKTYEALMDDATSFNESFNYSSWGDYTMDNSERYKDVEAELWEKFWTHFERVTGKPVKDKYKSAPYSCSC